MTEEVESPEPSSEVKRPADGPLAEFAALRSEILTRDVNTIRLLTFELTITSAVFAFALANDRQRTLLLAVPTLAYVISGRYLAQMRAVQQAAEYIAKSLDCSVPGGLKWEEWLDGDKMTRQSRMLGWMIPLLLAFPGVGVVALLMCFDQAFRSGGLLTRGLWLADVVFVSISVSLLWVTKTTGERKKTSD
ncbi:hypothetical protein AB0M80_28425 [Amycolatopsis sp. NPDC051045]|uniref:hypothetical protein n=1 Tax=Amycolatopsis sp. NPDC051045 TaxID=3156922 RepID=UPI0034373F00